MRWRTDRSRTLTSLRVSGSSRLSPNTAAHRMWSIGLLLMDRDSVWSLSPLGRARLTDEHGPLEPPTTVLMVTVGADTFAALEAEATERCCSVAAVVRSKLRSGAGGVDPVAAATIVDTRHR